MDLWLTCKAKGLISIKYDQEYQVVDISPENGLVKIINEFNNQQWYEEVNFKKAKREDIIMEKQFYGKIELDFNIIGNKVTASCKGIDRKIPTTESLNKLLGVKCPFDIDVKITKEEEVCKVEIIEKDDPLINGIYNNNKEALAAANNFRQAIDYFNDILIRTEVKLEKVYNVKFSPKGKTYTFRNVNEDIEVGNTVICRSSIGDQYAVVHSISEVDEEDWRTRSYCRKLKTI